MPAGNVCAAVTVPFNAEIGDCREDTEMSTGGPPCPPRSE
jgi:hypothetical protein